MNWTRREKERDYGQSLQDLADRYEVNLDTLRQEKSEVQRQLDEEITALKDEFSTERAKLEADLITLRGEKWKLQR